MPEGAAPAAVFATRRLRVRPWTLSEADVAAAFAVFGDPEVTRFLTRRETTLEGQRRGLAALRKRTGELPAGLGWFAVERLADGAVVGCALLKPRDGAPDEIELGYHLARAHWGRGYATEVARGLLAHGFGTLGLARIVAVVDPANAASLRVIARLGMEPAGETEHRGRPALCFALSAPGPGGAR